MVRRIDGYRFKAELPPGRYDLWVTIDEDGDGVLFEEGERWSAYPEVITVKAGEDVTGLDVLLQAPTRALISEDSEVGAVCDASGGCSGVCLELGPGYCSAACFASGSAACPGGSSCHYSEADAPQAYCLADCVAPGEGQSNCRTGQICVANSTGQGSCLPE